MTDAIVLWLVVTGLVWAGCGFGLLLVRGFEMARGAYVRLRLRRTYRKLYWFLK